MPEDEIITLETGEQVRVVGEGERVLIPGPDPEIEDMKAHRAEQQAKQAALQQEQLDVLAAKQEQDAVDPAVPPEKRIF